MESPCLYVVACGARPAGDVLRAVELGQAAGFTVAVVPTPMALRFIADVPAVEKATGLPVRSYYKRPQDPDVLPLPDAFLVSPLTFNSLNKWAQGNSDTLAMGLLNEAIGLGVQIAAVPWVNAQLAKHPAAEESLKRLRMAGVEFTAGFGHPSTRIPGPDGSVGQPRYPWDEIEIALARMASQLG
ncbi:flavoprotein [Actinospica acidithermotolerans]|uniref:flavoprotein n=1 Tax=Actinospica acidithermotolerans TaxID=2828514 RepID=UPI001BA8E8A1|nr:flavoprotein [Actinospica acidithermotolerans]